MLRSFILLLCLFPGFIYAQDWQVKPEKSSLTFESAYQGDPIRGRFNTFEAKIRFDPVDLANAHIEVNVDLASVSTRLQDANSMLPGADFFNVEKFPQAKFISTAFSQTTENNFEGQGTLSIRGQEKPVTLKIKFTSTSSGATLDANTTLNRLDFNIGSGDWKDADLISHEVPIYAHLELMPK